MTDHRTSGSVIHSSAAGSPHDPDHNLQADQPRYEE